MSLVVPDPLATVIIEEARRVGVPPEALLADKLTRDMDPRDKIKVYVSLFKKFLSEARDYVDKGDTVQASEKYWGAIASLLNIIGELRNMPHYKHSGYWDIIELVAVEIGGEIIDMYGVAERLHANFYHNFIRKENFAYYRKRVERLIEVLKEYIKSRGVNINGTKESD